MVENKTNKSARERLIERLSTRFPDRVYGDKGEQAEQDGQGAQVSDLDESVLEYLDECESREKEHAENEKRMLDLFTSDPVSAQFLNDWARTKNPAGALVGLFGLDAVREAFESEEARKLLAEKNTEWLERKAKDEASLAEREKNFGKSLESLDRFGNANGLDDEQKKEIFVRLVSVGDNALNGVFAEDDYRMAMRDMNYDDAVNRAREDGVIDGRNAKIEERRRGTASKNEMPAALSGQGMASPKRKREPDIFDMARLAR